MRLNLNVMYMYILHILDHCNEQPIPEGSSQGQPSWFSCSYCGNANRARENALQQNASELQLQVTGMFTKILIAYQKNIFIITNSFYLNVKFCLLLKTCHEMENAFVQLFTIVFQIIP